MTAAATTSAARATEANWQPNVRADIVARRTYCRPLDEAGTTFETWSQVIARVIRHQTWLWERAQGGSLTPDQAAELEELRALYLTRKALPAGRTLWLGGTELVKRREASNFNCSFCEVRSVHDVVDGFWMLLQGCGLGFKPVVGSLSGFTRRMEVEIVRSERRPGEPGGRDTNLERFDSGDRVWTIEIGDSAEAWAKSIGKILAGKYPARKLVLDFRQIRQSGTRLKGYGWICCGDGNLSAAYAAIAEIMNRRVGKLLSKSDIWDIVNWLGTVLSNRRSAQIGLVDYGDPEWRAVAERKPPGFDRGPNWFRCQSNNSISFEEWPGRKVLRDIFDLMIVSGGSEPGFVNAAAARRRAPWYRGLNPCGEILLIDKGTCNLVENDVAAFPDDDAALHRAIWLNARANYRQSVVDFRDGILQDAWHQSNEYLHLCGVSLTGIIRRPDLGPHDYRRLRYSAAAGAYAMADELGLERPKNITCGKPSGTASKVMSTTEGIHRPLGRYLVNRVQFNRHDPLLKLLCEAGYRMEKHAMDPDAVIVAFPMAWEDVAFDVVGGVPVNRESAVAQLERYRMLQEHWSDQNMSCTVSYEPEEVRGMIDWFQRNWDHYVGVSFLFRADHTKTAEQLGYCYLPQTITTREEFESYAATLRPIDLGTTGDLDAFEAAEEPGCSTGVCPIR